MSREKIGSKEVIKDGVRFRIDVVIDTERIFEPLLTTSINSFRTAQKRGKSVSRRAGGGVLYFITRL